jgi:hypothetical protein
MKLDIALSYCTVDPLPTHPKDDLISSFFLRASSTPSCPHSQLVTFATGVLEKNTHHGEISCPIKK